MRTIKISFLSALLCLISHVCFAQAYKYECKQIDENFYICQLNESYEDELILLKLGCKYNTTTVFGFWGVPFLKYGGLEKGSVLKLFLSNGEILTGKRQNDTSNSLSFILGSQEFYSSKVSITDNDKRANYIMRQLRKYNIIKFSVNGKITSTPNFRSAATIDAMCKTLISKTGDQGQYGSINTSSKSPGKSSSTSSNKSQKSVTNIKSYKKCPDNNHPHMIDLGLPSGTKWACCNVGASKPEGYGGCYAWGETAKKSIYDGDTYKYGTYNLPNDDDKNKLVNIGSDIQGTQYDAATANWGSQWVMPSIEQMEELKNNCTSEWTTKNGVKGRRFTGTNGASIFLPAVGYRWLGNARNHAGTQGFYWSSTLGESRTNYAFNLWFHSGYVGTDYDNRCHGYSVRPVRKN